jgi:hypothetical protein
VKRARAIACLMVALAACSSGTAPVSSPSASSTPTPSASASRSPRPSASARGTSSPKASGSVSPRGTVAVHVQATLDRSCVKAGDPNGKQGITITARPGGAAGFNTIYSDGSSSVDGKSHYDSGYGGGFADSSGHFRETWVVPANAPGGRATVRVVAIEDTPSGPAQGTVDLHFVVATANHGC